MWFVFGKGVVFMLIFEVKFIMLIIWVMICFNLKEMFWVF